MGRLKYFLKQRHSAVSIILILLIILHGLFSEEFLIDNFTIIIVIILVLLPYIPLLSKIRIGEFEAEISHEDVKELNAKADQIIENKDIQKKEKDLLELENLVISDPTLALAKARIEIEKRLKLLSEIYLNLGAYRGSLSRILNDLFKKKILSKSEIDILNDVILFANQAIHGALIESDDAIKLVAAAKKGIDILDNVVITKALSSKLSSKIIGSDEVESYIKADYILETIIPYVDNPKKNIYELNQAELESFLQNYDEYSEFIISLSRKEQTNVKKL